MPKKGLPTCTCGRSRWWLISPLEPTGGARTIECQGCGKQRTTRAKGLSVLALLSKPGEDGKIPKILTIAPVELERHVNRMSDVEKEVVRQYLANLAATAGFVAGYLDARSPYGGTSAREHTTGVKFANRKRKAIRKIFGYHTTPPIPF